MTENIEEAAETDEAAEVEVATPPTDETGVCVCGGDIERIDGEWYHSRIEDFSHTAEPAE